MVDGIPLFSGTLNALMDERALRADAETEERRLINMEADISRCSCLMRLWTWPRFIGSLPASESRNSDSGHTSDSSDHD